MGALLRPRDSRDPMPELPVIQRIILSQYRQFRFCEVPLTHPDTGAPLRQVCLLGKNGSGKSSLLLQLYRAFQFLSGAEVLPPSEEDDSLVLVEIIAGGDTLFLAFRGAGNPAEEGNALWFDPSITESPDWEALPDATPGYEDFIDFFSEYRIDNHEKIPEFVAPAALSYFSPDRWMMNNRPLPSFEGFLRDRRAERQRQYHDFLRREENRTRTVDEVEHEFQEQFPGVLFALADLWRETLAENFITFRPGYEPPFHCRVTGDDLDFSSLASGLRRYLIGTAELYSRFFHHPEYSGILFLETPETGLHPSLVSTLMQFYQELNVEHPGPLFVETHSDVVAARFAPEERFHFQFDPEEGVRCTLDSAPRHGAPAKSERPGRRRSRSPRVERLRRAIRETADQDELADLIDEVISFRRDRS